MTVDRLSSLLTHFSVRAGIFHVGRICGVHQFRDDPLLGHLHLVKRGSVHLLGQRYQAIEIAEPTILFLPRAGAHQLVADEATGADVVCGTVRFGVGGGNPVTDSLPPVVMIGLASLPGAEALLRLMFDEAFSTYGGRQAALDRLCEVLVILLLRHCMDQRLAQGGMLAGLSDKRLADVLLALQADPAHAWDLPEMASRAGMSRARFAARFREVTGETPADFLASWRIMLAQRLLCEGHQLKQIADDVGYGSASALTRAFIRKVGCTPTEWRKGAAQSAEDETAGHANETDGTLRTAHGA